MDKGVAIDAVLALMRRGYTLIDVGCFQVDILYHAGKFRSLDEAFDPDRNAAVAAQLLAELRLTSPDWATAVARYHSATPSLGLPYLEQVRAAFADARRRASLAEYEEAALGNLTGREIRTGPGLPRVVYPPNLIGAQPEIVRISPRLQ